MDDFDYKKYSLQKLEDWICDAVSTSEASPHEIYNVIIRVVEEHTEYYKREFDKTTELLSLLKGHRSVNFENNQQGSTVSSLSDNYRKQVEKELLEAQINANSSYNDGWTKKYYEDRVKKLEKKLGISKEDKVVKWVLPVEVDGPSGEYFVTFPDDLLEAAGLKEGDTVEWIDNRDGSFILRKTRNE